MLNSAAGALSGLVVLFLITHYMTLQALGLFAFALSAVGIAASFARLGFDNAHIKRVSEGHDLGDCIATYAWIKVTLALLLVAVGSIAAVAWDRLFGFHDATTLPILVAALLYAAVAEFRFVPVNTFGALTRVAKMETINLVDSIARVPAVALVAFLFATSTGRWVPVPALQGPLKDWLGDTRFTAADGGVLIVAAYTFALFLSFLVGAFMMWRHRYPFGHFRAPLARSYARFAIPMALLIVLSTFAMQLDKVMLGYFWSADEVGYYFTAQRIVMMVLVLPSAVGAVFFPIISEMVAKGRRAEVRVATREAQRLLSIVMVLATMFLIVFAREGLSVYPGPAYVPAAGTMRLLAVHALLLAFTTISMDVVMGLDRPRAVAAVGAVTVVLNLTLNLLLIPVSILGVQLAGLGMEGAATATVIAQVFTLGALAAILRRHIGGTAFSKAMAWHVAAGTATAAVLVAAKSLPLFGGVDRFHELLMIGTLGTVVYLLLLVAARQITKQEWHLVKDLFHPGRMVTYVRNEMRVRR